MTITSQQSISSNARWILLAICILAVMVQIDYTAVNVALPAMAKSVHTNLTIIQWVLSAYTLAWGAMVLPAGRLSDLFGKRRIFLIGTTLFIIGSAMTALAFSAWFIILSRVIQGVGGALFIPALYTLVFTAYPESKRGHAIGILTSALAVGMAIGPTFGGIILHLLNWRWIFYLNIPLGLPVLAIIFWAANAEPWRLVKEPMDNIGTGIFATLIFIFIYSLDQLNNWGLFSFPFLSLIVFCICLLSLFIYWEKKISFPLIRLGLFKNIPYLGCSITFVTMGYNFATLLITGSLYLQNGHGYSALQTGYIFLPMTIAFGLLSIFGGKLADRIEIRIPIVLGGLFTALAMFLFAFLNQTSPLWQIVIVLLCGGVGIGLGFPALNAGMMQVVSQEELNTASGAFSMFCCVGNTIGLIFSANLVVFFSKQHLHYLLNSNLLTATNVQYQQLNSILNSTHYDTSQLTQFATDQVPIVFSKLKETFMYGKTISVLIAMGIAFFGIIISFIMIKIRQSSKVKNKVPHLI